MGAFKAKLPRANPPICWLCDGRLYGGGRFYALVEVDGASRPAHKTCAEEATAPVKHHAVESVPEKDAAFSFLPEGRPIARRR